jgi:hypothetical protein
LLRGIGVGAHGHAGGLLAPVHELDVVLVLLGLLGGLVAVQEARDDLGRSGLDLAGVDEARGAVDGEEVTFLEGLAIDGDRLAVVIDADASGAAGEAARSILRRFT